MLANGYTDTYYARTLEDDVPYPVLSEKLEADVCVVGGGLAGINTALGLVARGKSVVLLEQHRIGWGASGRNGGFVAKGYSAGDVQLLKNHGRQLAQEFIELTNNARETIRSRMQDLNLDCGHVQDGVLMVSCRDNPKKTQDYVETANGYFDVGFEYWPKEKLRAQLKTNSYFDACFMPREFQFHPLKYLHGLARNITRLDGKIFENSKTISIEKDGSAWVTRTAKGSVKSEHVVLCCSIYIDDLDKRLKNAVFPVRTYVTTTKEIDEDVLESAIGIPYAIYEKKFSSNYYRRLPGNRLMWGGRVSLWGREHNIAAAMLQDMISVYPQLKGYVEIEDAWSGRIAYAPHKMPQIGQLEPGYWYNTAFGGHGLCPTTVGGELIASAIAEKDEQYKIFEPFGLGYAGGRMGRYVAQMVYWWWRLRDFTGM